jgi:hypothetical protein
MLSVERTEGARLVQKLTLGEKRGPQGATRVARRGLNPYFLAQASSPWAQLSRNIQFSPLQPILN